MLRALEWSCYEFLTTWQWLDSCFVKIKDLVPFASRYSWSSQCNAGSFACSSCERAWLDWQQSMQLPLGSGLANVWMVWRRRPVYVCSPSIYTSTSLVFESGMNWRWSFKVRAIAYDIVLNGYELGGGSLRINHEDLQERLRHLDLQKKLLNEQFGFLLEAMDYGFPLTWRIGDWIGTASDASCRWR